MRVLIVDDKEDARYLLQSLLAGHGHQVSTASDGEEALEAARSDPPELIISDILMPKMDGFRLCQEVRKDPVLREASFVFYTATYTQESDAQLAMKLGADDFIRKPAEPDAFIARIEAVIEKAAAGAPARGPQTADEAEVLRLYSERLVAKLEKRSIDLQEELSRRRQAEERLRRHARRLEVLHAIDVAILEAQSPESVAQTALEGLRSILRCPRASIATFDLSTQQATVIAVQADGAPVIPPGEALPIASFGDPGRLSAGEVHRVDDLAAVRTPSHWHASLIAGGIRSCLTVPLRACSELIGVLNVGFSSPDGASDEATQTSNELANQIAIALRQAQLREEVERHADALQRHVEELSLAKSELEASYASLSLALSQTVEALAAAAEVRDPYTAGHQRRVTALAIAIAEDLGLGEAQIEGLRVAGLMHDIGKLAIPAELLSKPGRLSETEYGLIRGHPETARSILRTVQFPWPISEIVMQHHERLDGSGYPNALKGDEILLEARILAVADVVEAMSSHRPYRAALGTEKAVAEIEAGAGTRYDSSVVDACVRLFATGAFAFEDEAT